MLMEGHFLKKIQVDTDRNITFNNSALVNTQVVIDFENNKDFKTYEYDLQVYNPSTVTDLTIKVFSIEKNVDDTNTRYSYITSYSFPKSQTVTGTTINMLSKPIYKLFNGTGIRFVISNDTVLGAAEGFTGILRLKEVI